MSERTKRPTAGAHEAAVLNRCADRVLGGLSLEYYLQRQPRRPLPQLSDAERLEIARYLRARAGSLVAERRRGRRPSQDKPERSWKIALDYRLTKKRVGSDAAVMEVGDAWYGTGSVKTTRNGRGWNSPGKRVIEAYGKCTRALPRDHPSAWREWAKVWIRRFRLQHPRVKGNALLKALSESLRPAPRRAAARLLTR